MREGRGGIDIGWFIIGGVWWFWLFDYVWNYVRTSVWMTSIIHG